MLDARRSQVAAELAQNHRRLEQVDMRLAQIEREGVPPDESEVVVKPLPAVTVASVRSVVPSVERVSDYCDDHFGRIAAWLTGRGIPADGLTMNLYHMDEYRETDLDMESVVVIDAAKAAGSPSPGDGAVGVRSIAAQATRRESRAARRLHGHRGRRDDAARMGRGEPARGRGATPGGAPLRPSGACRIRRAGCARARRAGARARGLTPRRLRALVPSSPCLTLTLCQA